MLRKRTKNPSSNQTPENWLVPAILIVASSVFAITQSMFGETVSQWLRYEYTLVENHHYWRLLTGHFIHLSWTHLGLNIAGVVLVWELVKGVLTNKQWLVVIFSLCIGISCAFLLLDKNLEWYVGLSGVLHGILFLGLILNLFNTYQHRKKLLYLELGLLIILSFKLLFEQSNGAFPWARLSLGGEVVVNAHLYGAIIGTILALIYISVMNKNVAR